MDSTLLPTDTETEELSPPTMRSPESTLRVRDHVVAVEVELPRPAVRRAKAPSDSGIFTLGSVAAESEVEPPTRSYRVA